MAAVVIFGSGRGAGKTAVGCALIAAMPEFQWVAVKVTPHLHDRQAGLREETELDSSKDTARYLRAGAMRSFLISASRSSHAIANGQLLGKVAQLAPVAAAWIVEGGVDAGDLNEIAGPVVSVAILRGRAEEWKPSVLSRLASADALVVTGGGLPEQLSPELQSISSFYLPEGQWVSAELLSFVRARLRH